VRSHAPLAASSASTRAWGRVAGRGFRGAFGLAGPDGPFLGFGHLAGRLRSPARQGLRYGLGVGQRADGVLHPADQLPHCHLVCPSHLDKPVQQYGQGGLRQHRGDQITAAVLRRVCIAIRDAREETGLSQTELAARIGIAQSALSRIEAGRANLTLGTLQRVTDALGVSLRLGVGSHEVVIPAA
jgi:DNA-binding XRE family transcriptional regulator